MNFPSRLMISYFSIIRKFRLFSKYLILPQNINQKSSINYFQCNFTQTIYISLRSIINDFKCIYFTYESYNSISSLNSSNSMDKKNPKILHWSSLEKLHYFFYTVLHKRELGRYKEQGSLNRRSQKTYKKMSDWLRGKRDFKQCRTHHEKQRKKFEDNISLLIDNLFKEYYIQRKIDLNHFKTEISYFLEKLLKDQRISDQEVKDNLKLAAKIIKQQKNKQNSLKKQWTGMEEQQWEKQEARQQSEQEFQSKKEQAEIEEDYISYKSKSQDQKPGSPSQRKINFRKSSLRRRKKVEYAQSNSSSQEQQIFQESDY